MVLAPGPVHWLRPAPDRVANSVAQAAPDLYFDQYSHVVGERHKLARLAPALLEVLAEYPELVIVIEGHADHHDLAHEYHDRLALERADAVRRVLLSVGFPKYRLRTVSFGDRAPGCPVLDDPCRRMNRSLLFRAVTQAAAQNPIGKRGKERALPSLRHFCRQVSPSRHERAARGASSTSFAESARVLERVELERKVEEQQT